jgi:hypothetical protein
MTTVGSPVAGASLRSVAVIVASSAELAASIDTS